MKVKSSILIIACIAWTLIFIYATGAQEGFEDVFSDSSEGPDQQNGMGDWGDSESGAGGIELEYAGSISTEITSYPNVEEIAEARDVVEENDLVVRPEAGLDLRFTAQDAEGVLNLELSPTIWLEDTDLIVSEIVDELYARLFFGIGYLDAGLLKIEWGNGDGVHVVDPVNPHNFSRGPVDLIMKSKIARPLVRGNIYLGDLGLLELVYVPTYSPYVYADEGRWVITDFAGSVELPSTDTLEYGQLALRATGTIGPLDLGLIYYFGFFQESAFEIAFTGTDPFNPADYTLYTYYNRSHLFGAEVGSALGPFSFRLEAGYWMTGDFNGDDPYVYNHRIVYLPGVDVTIPGIQLFLSLQLMGDFTFINIYDLEEYDVDRLTGYGSPSHNNMVIAAAELPLYHDRITISAGGMYAFEAQGFLIRPQVEFALSDNMFLSISGLIIDGESHDYSTYYSWRRNDSVSIALDYAF